MQAEYPVYPGYGEEEDQHLQDEEEEDQKSGERGSGLNVKDEVLCHFTSFCSNSSFTKHEISFCARLASCSWTLGRSPRFLLGGAGEGESG